MRPVAITIWEQELQEELPRPNVPGHVLRTP